jgi:hypothetical protein
VLIAVIVIRLNGDHPEKLRNANKILLTLVAAALVILYVLRYIDLFDIKRYLLPVVESDRGAQGLLTLYYPKALFNWLFMSALAAPLLYVVRPRFDRNAETARRSFLAFWIIVPCLIFILFFTPQLGGPRDWDLFSLPFFLLLPALLLTYNSRVNESLWPGLLPVIALSFFVTGGMTGIHADKKKSVERLDDITEAGRFENHYIAYRTLLGYSIKEPELRDLERLVYFGEKAWHEPPYTAEDSIDIMRELSAIYIKKGEKEKARRLIDLAYEIDTSTFEPYMLDKLYQSRFGTGEELKRIAEAMAAKFPDNPSAQMNAGVISFQVGDTSSAEYFLKQAFHLDTTNIEVLSNYAGVLVRTGDYRQAAELLKRAVEIEPRRIELWLNLATTCAVLGERENALFYLQNASQLARTPEQKRQIEQLMRQFGL